MQIDKNLLFAVLALQADLLDLNRFAEAYALWIPGTRVSLAELVVERGWLSAADKSAIERLVAAKLSKYGENAQATLAATIGQFRGALSVLAPTLS
jgi:hypothetical protein